VIVVCQTGRRSAKAASVLRAAGIKDVFVLSGGVASWREAGLPLKAA
jgi:rhodanese-related sulfurtransferase